MLDVQEIVFNSLIQYWWLPLVLILFSIFKTPWFKGVLGEFFVNKSASFQLDPKVYHLIKNVTLPTEDGSTQIDHVFVSPFGVFVVETKNMKGWIFGSERQSTWTQQIYKSRTKFQNPLRQNYKHVKTLQSLLGLEDEQIFSVIAFVGDSTFKTDMPENVTEGSGYAKYIKSKTKPVLRSAQIKQIISKIESGRLKASFQTNREHVKNVRRLVETKEKQKRVQPKLASLADGDSESANQQTALPPCPKCGEPLVRRQVKKGPNMGKTFLGCSTFPKCRVRVQFRRGV